MSRNMRDVTFATINLYNLQLPDRPRYPNSTPYTREQYDAKVTWTAEALARLDADIVAFQELWSGQCLRDVLAKAKELGLAGGYAPAFIKLSWDGIAVAVAVREPWEIRATRRHKEFPQGLKLKKRKKSMAEIRESPTEADLDDTGGLLPSHEDDEIDVRIDEFSRSPLQVTIGHGRDSEVPAMEVFCTHLKSKLGTRLDIEEYRDDRIRPHKTAIGAALSTIRRTAEAAALRVILNDTMAGTDTPTVVLGDLNDGQFSNTLAILSDQPSFRLYADSRAARLNDDGLFTVAALQQLRNLRDLYYTHEYKGVQEILDHVMVSEQFYDYSDKRFWSFREMRVLNDHVEDGRLSSSDHGVVAASFDWNPA